ncbi:hypothetical protein CAEBREN_06909 [Caenorhabditis brenneri]|uniref:F-box associated domain-containing protein n=1 Tax=Caenorhabditis brenneri TaxID=135651 RepID=G0MQL0_CAEBE|nr:hypothetical protein CAEBREN_06909 [Caenorhabditis brenneri]
MKILNLPFLAQRRLITAMDGADIIGLSFTSLRCRRLVRSVNLINVHTIVDCVNFLALAQIQFGGNGEKRIIFQLKDTEVEGGRTIPIVWVNQNSFDLRHEDVHTMPGLPTVTVRRQAFGKLCMRLLMEVFGAIGELAVVFGIEREFYFEGLKLISAPRHHHDFFMPSEQLTQYFTNFYEELALPFPVVGENNLTMDSTLLNIPRIIIHDARWMSGQALTNFRGTDGIFIGTEFTNKEVMVFIYKWLRGNNTTLRSMLLWQKQANSLDRGLISEKFRFNGWNPEQRPQHYNQDGEYVAIRPELSGIDIFSLLNILPFLDVLRDCQDGMDIVRRRDGMLATVKVWRNTVVCFYVWHQIQG